MGTARTRFCPRGEAEQRAFAHPTPLIIVVPAHSASKTRVNALMLGTHIPVAVVMGPRFRGDDGDTPCPERERHAQRVLPAVAKHDEGGVVVAAPLELVESRGRGEGGTGRLLDHDERAGREPAAGAGRGQRLLGEASAVGRIDKDERERLDRMRRAELARVAPENAA